MSQVQHFAPDKGTYFYTQKVPTQRVIGDSIFGNVGVEPKVILQQDNSYADEVLLCIARDDHAVLADRVKPAYSTSNTQVLLPISKWNFYPVGPEVLAALGIGQSEAA